MHSFDFSHSQVLSPLIHFQGQNKVVFICSHWFGLVFFVSCPLQDCTGVKTKDKEMQIESFFGTKAELLGLPSLRCP